MIAFSDKFCPYPKWELHRAAVATTEQYRLQSVGNFIDTSYGVADVSISGEFVLFRRPGDALPTARVRRTPGNRMCLMVGV
jgi:hypothetical protein